MIKCTLCNETCSISKLLTNKYSCLMLEIFPQEKVTIKLFTHNNILIHTVIFFSLTLKK